MFDKIVDSQALDSGLTAIADALREKGAEGELTFPNGFTGAIEAMEPGTPGEKGDPGEKGADGATFFPSVDGNGNLSWRNDGGLPNPEPVNIKGPAGDAYTLTEADRQAIAALIPTGGGSAAEQRMTQLADITITEETPYFLLTGLDHLTEFFIIFDNVNNATTTTSAINISIGESADRRGMVCMPNVNVRSGLQNHGWASVRFNGMFWVPIYHNGNTVAALQGVGASIPIIVNEEVELQKPATAITLWSNWGYAPVSGRIRVWGR